MDMNEDMITLFLDKIGHQKLKDVFYKMIQDFAIGREHLQRLYEKWSTFYKEGMTSHEALISLIQASDELTSVEEPFWEMIAGRFLVYDIICQVQCRNEMLGISTFYQKIQYLTQEGYYGNYILEHYASDEIEELSQYIQDQRNELLNYSGLDMLYKRYLIQDHDHHVLETPQEMFMGIAMHLAMLENDRVY